MKAWTAVLLLLAQVLTSAFGHNVTKDYCKCGTENNPSISAVGGTKSPLLYPWMVSIGDVNGNSFCGGVLINRKEIITSANCVEGKTIADVILTLGVHDLSRVTEKDKFKVKTIQAHKDYLKTTENDTTTYDNDIALLSLHSDITYAPNILPICLPRVYLEKPSAVVTVLGWGQLSADVEDRAQRLQMLTRKTIPTDECGPQWGRTFKSAKTLCMGQFGHNICAGDYGGPLQVEYQSEHWELAGIASTSGPTCGDKFPGVYTNFEFYRKWLRNNSELYSHCYE